MIQSALPELDPVKEGQDRSRLILIVDDDESQVEVLAHRFEHLGFHTLAAYEGQRGVDLARNRHPDVMLLDLRLPDMTGFEVCEKLTNSPETCDIPIIIISGMEGPDIVRMTRKAGCTFYLRKPYDPNSLLALVERALEEAQQW